MKFDGSEYYESPPARARQWRARRPGDIAGFQPHSDGLGSQGPDQGYAYKLAQAALNDMHLVPGESRDDVVAGVVTIALKRASQFMRAPSMHDIEAACALFDFFNSAADPDLVERRSSMFAGISHPHHYRDRRILADSVPAQLLRQPLETIRQSAGNFQFDLLSGR